MVKRAWLAPGSGRQKVVGVAVGLIVVATLVLLGDDRLALGAVVVGGINLAVLAGRARSERRSPDGLAAPTGRALAPAAQPVWLHAVPDAAGRRSWRGGARLWGWLGYIRASAPLARLQLSASTVTVDMGPLGRLLGVRPLSATAGPAVCCHPVRSGFAARGVALHVGERPPAYFWTNATAEILSALDQAGFAVSWEERGTPGLLSR